MGHSSAHLVTVLLSVYCLSLLDVIAVPMAEPYISALYDYYGPMTRAFRLLFIVPTPSNAPKCRGSKRGTHRPPGWRPRTRGDKIGPSDLTPTFSRALKMGGLATQPLPS